MATAKTAKEDIVVKNVNGQDVVVVHAGQAVPANLDELKAQAQQGPIVQAEDKAVRSGKRK